MDQSTHFAVTKADHCPPATLLTLGLTSLETELDDLDWVIRRHKAVMLATGAAAPDDGNYLT